MIAHNDLPEAPQLLVELDNKEIEVTHGRIKYDIEMVSTCTRRLGIPEMLTSRLFQSCERRHAILNASHILLQADQ